MRRSNPGAADARPLDCFASLAMTGSKLARLFLGVALVAAGSRSRSIGAGVREIRISDDSGAFRVVYLTKVEDSIVILHCFQRKTAKTDQRDIKLARARYKSLFPPH